MENASKALIIAGAILIAILLTNQAFPPCIAHNILVGLSA